MNDEKIIDPKYLEDLSDYLVEVTTKRPYFYKNMQSAVMQCKQRFLDGDVLAVHDALTLCEQGMVPLPLWLRLHPKLEKDGDNNFVAKCKEDWRVQDLMGMRTQDAAHGVYMTAITALGKSAEKHANFVSAIFAETEPRDAIEAMLISQMAITYVAMTTLSERMTYQNSTDIRESLERSMTRLSRTYLAQMDALKKYRAKAQQIVRVERVTVNEGGQAIVGDVSHRGEG